MFKIQFGLCVLQDIAEALVHIFEQENACIRGEQTLSCSFLVY